MTAEVDIARIVPSTRDVLHALQTSRRSLALVCCLAAEADGDGSSMAAEATRLDALDVRAFAVDDVDARLVAVARATRSIPLLCTAAASTVEALQRARYFGVDGVAIAAGAASEWQQLSSTATSMRMAPVAEASELAHAQACCEWGARAVLLRGTLDTLVTAAAALPRRTILLAAPSDSLSAPQLTGLVGKVDAVLVPASLHANAEFETLLADVDG